MEITRHNFAEKLDLVQKSIHTADYIAFDTEFSGHYISLADRGHEYETMEERYQKLKTHITQFTAFQVGLTTFRWSSSKRVYTARPFCFYVHPRTSQNWDKSHLFQTGAVNFLTENNFDFNKLFKEAISYTRLNDVDQLREKCMNKVLKKQMHTHTYQCLSLIHQEQLQDFIKQIEAFVFDPTNNKQIILNIPSQSLKKALSKEVTRVYMGTGIFADYKRDMPETLIKKSKQFKQANFLRGYVSPTQLKQMSEGGIEGAKIKIAELGFTEETFVNNFAKEEVQNKETEQLDSIANQQAKAPKIQKKTMQQEQNCSLQPYIEQPEEEIKNDFSNLQLEKRTSSVMLGFTENSDVSKGKQTDDPLEELTAAQKQEFEQMFMEEFGFTQIIQMMIDARKPLIGHNMIYDIAFFYNQFIEKLPATFREFSTQVSVYWPEIYDTKVFSLEIQEGKSDLSRLFKGCITNKKYSNNLVFQYCDSEEEFQSYENSQQAHDAGYDAYMTGVVFATLAKFIEIGQIINRQPSANGQIQKQHYSVVQNRPVEFPTLSFHKNRVMLHVDTKRYWNFGQTKKAETEIRETERQIKCCLQVHFPKLYTRESIKIQNISSECLFEKEPTLTEIAELFTEFGDLMVIKQEDGIYWIDFEEFTDERITILKVINQMQIKKVKAVSYDQAVRFF